MGAVSFAYDPSWLAWEYAVPVSVSLPLREDRYTGVPVAAVFENLLPDSDSIRNHVAERVGAAGIDAFSLLTKIGRDCIGALQFIPEESNIEPTFAIHGTIVNEEKIEKMLCNLVIAPLG